MPDNKKNNALVVIDAMHQRFVNPPDFYVSSLGVCVRNPAAQKPRSIFSVTAADFDDPTDLPPITPIPPPPITPPPPATGDDFEARAARLLNRQAATPARNLIHDEAFEARVWRLLNRPTIH